MSKPESAIIIVNSATSALEILADIEQFARVFVARPVRLLRCDNPEHIDMIRALQAKYKIASAPALIARDGSAIIGKAKIREFIPKLARVVSKIAAADKAPDSQRPPTMRRIAQYCSAGDKDDDGDDDDKKGPDIGQKIAQYRKAMAERGARICETGDAPPRAAAPAAGMIAGGADDDDDDGPAPTPARRAATTAPGAPPPPNKRTSAPVREFEERFFEGIQADLDADMLAARRDDDLEGAIRKLVTDG